MEGVIKAFEITLGLFGTLSEFELVLTFKVFELIFIIAELFTFRLTPEIIAGDDEHDGERDKVAIGLKLRWK